MSNTNIKYNFTKDQYKAKITKIISEIDDLWILDQIYRATLNVTETKESEVG